MRLRKHVLALWQLSRVLMSLSMEQMSFSDVECAVKTGTMWLTSLLLKASRIDSAA